MSRTTLVLFLVLGAALASGFLASNAERLRGGKADATPSVAAGPQREAVTWRETIGPPAQRVVFEVRSIQVTRGGWRVRLALENRSAVAFGLGDPRATLDRSFGLMLFESGDLQELEERNASRTLPTIRAATNYEPKLPAILEPGKSWEGEISAKGALAAGTWVRVVFGALVAVGKTPDELPEKIVWITDHAYRLLE